MNLVSQVNERSPFKELRFECNEKVEDAFPCEDGKHGSALECNDVVFGTETNWHVGKWRAFFVVLRHNQSIGNIFPCMVLGE